MGLLIMAETAAFPVVVDLNPELRIINEYTDNVDLREDDTTSSFITVIAPGFTADISGENGTASLAYLLGYSIYSESSEKNAFRQQLDLKGETDLSKRTRLTFSDNLVQTEEPTAVDDPLENRDREPLIRNTANLLFGHDFSRYDTMELQYEHSLIESDDPDTESSTAHRPSINYLHRFNSYQIDLETGVAYTRGEFDGPTEDVDIWLITASLTKEFTRRFSGFINYQQTVTQYDEGREDEQENEKDQEDYQVYGLSAGIDTQISKTLSLLAEAGYFIQERDAATDDRSDLLASIAVTKMFKYATFRLNGSTGYRQTYFEGENLGFSTYYEADCSIRYRFTKDLDVGLIAYHRIDEFEETTPERTDRATGAGADLSWQIQQPLLFALDFRYRTEDSDDPTESEDSYSLGASLSYEWKKWLITSFGLYHREVDAEINNDDYKENRVIFEVTMRPPRPIRTIH